MTSAGEKLRRNRGYIGLDTHLHFCPFDDASEIIEDADVWYGS